ncbi:sensor histidine kinase [Pontibacter mangrovi]|nr:HAMP domain-containing sensor histidine kinase [Pontibacter mangrovi]
MRLLQKINKAYLVSSAVVLAVCSTLLYFILQRQAQLEIDEELALQEELISAQIAQGQMPSFPLTDVRQLNSTARPSTMYGDSVVFDRLQLEHEDYRYLRSVKSINGKTYSIMVMDAHVGWADYYLTIFAVFLVMALLLGCTGLLVNYFAARSIWQPFFQNLKVYRSHSVSSGSPLQLQPSNVQEFREMQLALQEQTQRSRQEYLALREFTENASHEIQTPLAIIQAKLDRLSQYPISGEMMHHLALARDSVSRLSRINKNLLLLTKLENRAFEEKEQLDLRPLLQAQLDQMEDLFEMKHIALQTEISATALQANRYLIDILLSNLLANALRYTPENGKVSIRLSPERLEVANSGAPLTLTEDQLYARFKKGRANSGQSTGLGLAIAKGICEAHGWQLRYRYSGEEHHFEVRFA